MLLNLPSRTSSLLCSAPNSVGRHRLSWQHLPAVPTPNIAELVHCVFFFLSTTIVLRRSERKHVFPGKTPVCLSFELQSINSWISIKIGTRLVGITGVTEWLSRFPPERGNRIPDHWLHWLSFLYVPLATLTIIYLCSTGYIDDFTERIFRN